MVNYYLLIYEADNKPVTKYDNNLYIPLNDDLEVLKKFDRLLILTEPNENHTRVFEGKVKSVSPYNRWAELVIVIRRVEDPELWLWLIYTSPNKETATEHLASLKQLDFMSTYLPAAKAWIKSINWKHWEQIQKDKKGNR